MPKPLMSAHFLVGTTFPNLFRILVKGRFQISFVRILKLLGLLPVLILFAPLTIFDFLIYQRKIRKIKLKKPPIFIIGHSRTGTTYMHNLITSDKQFYFSSTYQCLMPNSFLSGGKVLQGILGALMPKKRPMDNVKMNVGLPQEDEFGVNGMSSHSYFQALCFPRFTKKYFAEYALLETGQVENWKKSYFLFLQKISYKHELKQMVSKNPVNTVRIPILLEMFPDAKFIYMRRDKDEVLNSAFNLYSTLSGLYSFQKVNQADIINNMLWVYEKTIATYEQHKMQIPDGNLIEVDYSDLITDPFTQIKKVYQKLNLQGFEETERSLKHCIESQKDFQVNTKTFYRQFD